MKRYSPIILFQTCCFISLLISNNSSAQKTQTPSCINQPPVISITSPVTGAFFNAGATIIVQAHASDADGTIAKVTFYENGNKLGEDTTAPYIYTGVGVEAGNYVLTAKATDNAGATACSGTVIINVRACTSSGTISAEGYRNTNGKVVSDIMKNPLFPDKPDVLQTLNIFEYGPNLGDQYAARVRGYICAPQTGNYYFYISGDDQVGVWLSTDDNPANKVLIAYAESWTKPREWNKYFKQKSALIKLTKGGRYYIETLHKEYVGPDHLAVAWTLPDGTFEAPIPGKRLSPWINNPNGGRFTGTDFNSAMTNMIGAVADVKSLKVTVTPNPSRNYFTIITNSNINDLFSVIVTDIMGRVVETRLNMPANGTLQLGNKLSAGIYFVEVKQGMLKQRLKLVKQ